MSTSTNFNNVPDAGLLEQLANQFFSALPGTQFNLANPQEQFTPAPAYNDTLLQQGSVDDVKQAPAFCRQRRCACICCRQRYFANGKPRRYRRWQS
jgi:hypothetical protein